MKRCALVAGVLFSFIQAAYAQEKTTAKEEQSGETQSAKETPLQLNPDGTYQGVAPGATNLPPKPPKLPVKGPNRMTWPGFQVKDGVATVFLQTTGAPDYSISDGKKGIVITIKNTTIPLKNNRRALKVSYFDSAVTEVDCKPKGKNIEVHIRTRQDNPAHAERVESAAGGFQMLIVDLPSPKKAE